MRPPGRPGHDARTALHEELNEVWRNLPGIRGQLSAVNHTTIGLRFIVTGFVFLLIGGLFAMFMRLQLAWSDQTVLDHQLYNELMTMHGTTMMLLFAVPVMEGFAVYLLPKMLGARDVPFPRASAWPLVLPVRRAAASYSSFLFRAARRRLVHVRTLTAGIPPGKACLARHHLRRDRRAHRRRGDHRRHPQGVLRMAIQRMPLFAWYAGHAVHDRLRLSAAHLGSILLELERAFAFFFDPCAAAIRRCGSIFLDLRSGGLHYLLAGGGIVSTLLPVFARRAIVGYGCWPSSRRPFSFGLWVHHMFTVGIPLLALSFSAASMAVSFRWACGVCVDRHPVADGRASPMYFILGFFFIFVLAADGRHGRPGASTAGATRISMAHLHYVIIGGC